jgi:hypothetical protein
MLNDVPAVKQATDYDCGAACCLYILQMLGLEGPGETQLPTIMERVRTVGSTNRLGSAPDKIGAYILERSQGRTPNVAVKKGPARPDRGGRFYLSYLDSGWAKFGPSAIGGNDPDFSKKRMLPPTRMSRYCGDWCERRS